MLEVLTILWAHETPGNRKIYYTFVALFGKFNPDLLGEGGGTWEHSCVEKMLYVISCKKTVMVSLIPGGLNNSDKCNYVCIFVLQKQI